MMGAWSSICMTLSSEERLSRSMRRKVTGRAGVTEKTLVEVSPSSLKSQKIPTCREPSPNAPVMTTLLQLALYPEKHVANLVDYLRVSACFAAGEALEGGEDEVGGVLEVEDGLHAIKVISRLVGERAVFDPDAPLAAPFAIDYHAELDIDAFDRFLVYG